jgi:hypothetical protein
MPISTKIIELFIRGDTVFFQGILDHNQIYQGRLFFQPFKHNKIIKLTLKTKIFN